MTTGAARHSLRSAVVFVIAVNAVTWGACLLLRGAAAAGDTSAMWTFLLLTVWSPTLVALAATAVLGGKSEVRALTSRLFRSPAHGWWYLAALVVPAAVVALAVLFSRSVGLEARFLPLAALLPVALVQLLTGATGEELGWRGLLLPALRPSFGRAGAALAMSALWSLWHLPAFFFPHMPQQLISPAAFLISVAAFGVFLALVFEETGESVLPTMAAHFSLNLALAVRGARFSSTMWWFLAAAFAVLAIVSLWRLQSSGTARERA